MRRSTILENKLLWNFQVRPAQKSNVLLSLSSFRTTTEAHKNAQDLPSSLSAYARQVSFINCAKPTCQRRSLFTISCTLHNTSETVVNKEAANNAFTKPIESNNTNNGEYENSNATALDVAMQVNKIKRLHQTGGSASSKKQLELEAWGLLNALTDEQINKAEGKAVSLLLNSWAYFAKYWENGKDGPAVNQAKTE